jgi:4-amino-4-deoxy-L-arabinose transferase-like glycosyltransferase
MNRKHTIALILVIVAAGVFRLGFDSLVVGWDTEVKGDEVDYHGIATSLSHGDGYRIDGHLTCRRPPLYPYLLALHYRVFGVSAANGRILQILLGMLLVYLVYRVARRYFDGQVGVIAAAIAAANPFLIMISGYLLTENLYMILMLTALLVAPTPARLNGPLRGVLGAAALLAAATLTRPTGLPVAIWTLAAGLIFGAGSLTLRGRNGLFAAALFIALLLPWSVRNQRVVGAWVGLTTHGGITFYQGNNQRVVDVVHYRGGVAPLAGLPHAQEIRGMSEVERERFTRTKGLEFLRDNKRLIPRLAWWKFARFWRLRSDSGLSGVRSGWWWSQDTFLGKLASSFDVGFVYAVVAFPLFLAGVVLTRNRWRELLFLYGVVIAHTAVALVFFGSIRGRIPVEPVIAIFAAVTVDRLYRWIRTPRPQ